MSNGFDKSILPWKLKTITKNELYAITYTNKKDIICKSSDLQLLKTIIKEHNLCIQNGKDMYQELENEYRELHNNSLLSCDYD